MRGGSWNNNVENARCAFRNRNNPHNSNNNIGFRLVSHDFRLPGRQCHGSSNDAGRGQRERRRDLSLAGTG
ncbi:MAG TPA: SUMF1/EgtB/PvdO family nonheme iron enzyme [Anaerolineae bacterium]|nr:SUMF1/EgtB/PvdO family nonheme iron enzyme [Anaerolineae bacterium]